MSKVTFGLPNCGSKPRIVSCQAYLKHTLHGFSSKIMTKNLHELSGWYWVGKATFWARTGLPKASQGTPNYIQNRSCFNNSHIPACCLLQYIMSNGGVICKVSTHGVRPQAHNLVSIGSKIAGMLRPLPFKEARTDWISALRSSTESILGNLSEQSHKI